MKYVDEFRDPEVSRVLRGRVSALAARLGAAGRRFRVMEVCGTHTMAIARYGIRSLLPPHIELVSGPGCPVCVTDPGYLDTAIELAQRDVIVATFGDMIYVPGSRSTLANARASGGRVEPCYSPSRALNLARQHRDREVVFLAVGFETTMAPVVSILDHAAREGLDNLSLLTAFKRIPPALDLLIADPELQIDALLCPAHVSAVIGEIPYRAVVQKAGIPCVIAGFEPVDILAGLEAVLEQAIEGRPRVQNLYRRVVRPEGNPKAREVIDRFLEPAASTWRGLGPVPGGAMALRPAFQHLDAEQKHGVQIAHGTVNPGCLCGDVIKGKCTPDQCALFGSACTPDTPIGPCMVSQEGTCAASYRYSGVH